MFSLVNISPKHARNGNLGPHQISLSHMIVPSTFFLTFWIHIGLYFLVKIEKEFVETAKVDVNLLKD